MGDLNLRVSRSRLCTVSDSTCQNAARISERASHICIQACFPQKNVTIFLESSIRHEARFSGPFAVGIASEPGASLRLRSAWTRRTLSVRCRLRDPHEAHPMVGIVGHGRGPPVIGCPSAREKESRGVHASFEPLSCCHGACARERGACRIEDQGVEGSYRRSLGFGYMGLGYGR